MKKSKSWIHVCVHFLLFITLGVLSARLDVNPVTDDVVKLALLRQNIPHDYIIPLNYIPKEEAGMCWVTVNVFYLETSLHKLSDKFGNISSNKNDLSIIIHILQELRLKMTDELDNIMYNFECHYREKGWETDEYFNFVEDFMKAARNRKFLEECDPPPCPTSPSTTSDYSTGSPTPGRSNGADCSTNCTRSENEKLLSDVVERSLLSLLLIPLVAFVFLLVWKVRSRRNREDLPHNPGEAGLFNGPEGTAPPLDAELSEKNTLAVLEIV
ncbi:kit ligand a [Pholidichthys leucotaenia]